MKYFKTILTLGLCIMGFSLGAQSTYTIPSSNKALLINELNYVSIIGTSESSARIEVDGKNRKVSERAKGLKLINGLGMEDNTDIGLSVVEEGDQMVIRQVSSKSNRRYTFYVPEDYVVSYNTTSNRGGQLNIENVRAELDISTLHNSIEANGVTGPMALHSIHGHIDVSFDEISQEGPINIYSIHGHLDISIPQSSKADLSMSTTFGEIYSDVDMDFESDNSGLHKISHNKIRAKINGGGTKITLQTNHSDIYLRKK